MKRIGIIGGMGPLASLFYAQQLILKHPVSKDQEQFHVVLDSNSSIPDRTLALLNQGESPVPAIKESLKMLQVPMLNLVSSHVLHLMPSLMSLKMKLNLNYLMSLNCSLLPNN
ncbi:MAG: hypothetical protein LRY24_00505 [Erysipelotrichaceae bacterium]|nr:hypothetical protein [Erysipelotrichaceae bacterium]